jgi:hypothetical protein
MGRAPFVGWAALLLSCGAGLPPLPIAPLDETEGAELEVRPGEHEQPPLRLRFRYASREGMLGSGGVHLWARPGHDEVRVTGIVDAPAKEARWTACEGGVLFVDGERVPLETRYIGSPMEGGHYDAVRIELGIHQLRRISGARRTAGTICGDPIVITAAQRRAIARFVAIFDDMAAPRQTEDAEGFREVGPTIDLMPNEDDDPGPYPA